MTTFFICIAILLIGYMFYSKYIERFMEVDPNRQTPAYSMQDGVDYVPMAWWRVLLIQFLNIASVYFTPKVYQYFNPKVYHFNLISKSVFLLVAVPPPTGKQAFLS